MGLFNNGKKKSVSINQSDWQFLKAIQGKELPILTLDPNWHALFAMRGKSLEIKNLERRLTDLLKEQSRLTEASQNMSDKKKQLMTNIIHSMSEDDDINNNLKAKQKRMIEKINQQAVNNEDELKTIPDRIKRVNEQLLLETFRQVYYEISINKNEIAELERVIDNLRVELNQRIMEKDDKEEYNHGVFSTIKDIVGMSPINIYEETHKSAKELGVSKS